MLASIGLLAGMPPFQSMYIISQICYDSVRLLMEDSPLMNQQLFCWQHESHTVGCINSASLLLMASCVGLQTQIRDRFFWDHCHIVVFLEVNKNFPLKLLLQS